MSASQRLSEDNSSPFRREKSSYFIISPSCMFLAGQMEVGDSYHRSEVSFSPSQFRPEVGDFHCGSVIKSSLFRHGRLPRSTTSTSPSQISLPKLSKICNSRYNLLHE